MSSGTLPLSSYHRAQSLGTGSYGSVITVYNDTGDEYALKLFDSDKDDDDDNSSDSEVDMSLALGTLRELSILRLLRSSNAHTNILALIDILPPCAYEEGLHDSVGGGGRMGMIMPLYPLGDLGGALDDRRVAWTQRGKVHLIHGLLCGVGFLHDQGILHRDIKADNVMLRQSSSSDDIYEPVLIDFSLAKIIEGDNSILPPGGTHTGEVGTVTYVAPEVVQRKPYSFPSDLWSVGVVCLELLRNHTLEVESNREAERVIVKERGELPEKPLANLVRGLLEVDVEVRYTAEQALERPLFDKFGLVREPQRNPLDIRAALNDEDDENVEPSQTAKTPFKTPSKTPSKTPRKSSKKPILTKRQRIIRSIYNELDCHNPKTCAAAALYAKAMEECEDDLENVSEGNQALLDCVVLASVFYEEQLVSLSDLGDNAEVYPSFNDWEYDTYVDNTQTIFMLLDYCLYLRGNEEPF